jgi:hypothetical protein
MTNVEIARAMYDAYENADRAGAEALLAPDFSFTSPLDNGLDRDGFFRICWPHGIAIEAFDLVGLVEDGNRVWVNYIARQTDGRQFTNVERLTIRGQRIAQVQVFFGWAVPHPVPAGEHRDPS